VLTSHHLRPKHKTNYFWNPWMDPKDGWFRNRGDSHQYRHRLDAFLSILSPQWLFDPRNNLIKLNIPDLCLSEVELSNSTCSKTHPDDKLTNQPRIHPFHQHQLQLQTITVPPQTSIDDSTRSFTLSFDEWNWVQSNSVCNSWILPGVGPTGIVRPPLLLRLFHQTRPVPTQY